MHYPLTHYHGIGYGQDNGLEADVAHDLALTESSLDTALDTIEETGSEVVQGIVDVVEESRQYAEHRKAVYMIGAPLIVYVGLTNTKHKGLGLLSALAGLYIGVKNYQDEKDSQQAAASLGGYGSMVSSLSSMIPGSVAASSRACVRKKPRRKCPPHMPHPRVRADGRVLCCRRR